MRLVIDLQGAQTESRLRGIGRYSLSLVKAMLAEPRGHEILIVLNDGLPGTVASTRQELAGLLSEESIRVWRTPLPVRGMESSNDWAQAVAEKLRQAFIASLLPDALLVTSLFEGYVDDAVTSVAIGQDAVPTAVVLFDLIPHVHRQTYLGDVRAAAWYDAKLVSLKAAHLLLSISESSRREAIKHLGCDANRIVNISTAADARFAPLAADEALAKALLARFGLSRPFIMYTGGADWRKNLPRLLDAFAALPLPRRATLQLALVGAMPEGNRRELRAQWATLGLPEQDLVLTGYVGDDDLHRLYTLCRCFVFPSWHEGFGLPPLEAMACGAVTLGAAATSTLEVIEDQEALFDPHDTAAIASRIESACFDESYRAARRANGLARAQSFSWPLTASHAWAALEAHFAPTPQPSSLWSRHLARRDSAHQRLLQDVVNVPRAGTGYSALALADTARSMAFNRDEAENALRAGPLAEPMRWQIEGPFDSSYSLALVNRQLALALDAAGADVSLHSTEGPGDFAPNPVFLAAEPVLARLHAARWQLTGRNPEIVSRLLYPPRVADLTARLNALHLYAWEESGFPAQWVDDFNTHLQGISCLSEHVRKIMLDNGVAVPLSVVGCGVDHWLSITPDESLPLQAKSFRFLHVSSCFPRKGVDVLLAAYGAAFSAQDDVTLVIKTFANPHNRIHDWLAEARAQKTDYPDVQIIEADLEDAQLKGLYKRCQVLVGVSRAEGFGLPFAEAMLSGLDVVTTAWGGQTDFCTSETAWLVDYRFARAETHFGLFGSVWAEPDVHHLASVLIEAQQASPSVRKARNALAQKLLLSRFRWQDVVQRQMADLRRWSVMPRPREPQIGWISSWNTRCGIAGHSEYLLSELPHPVAVLAPRATTLLKPDDDRIVRCWDAGIEASLEELAAQVERLKLDTLVIQFNYGFFSFEELIRFIDAQLDAGRIVVVLLHATTDPTHAPHKRLALLRDTLARCQRLLVTGINDLNRLKDIGLVDNVALFPLGVPAMTMPPLATKPVRRKPWTIASYGFFLPHKGLSELVEATALLKKQGHRIALRLVNAEYPTGESRAVIAETRARVAALGLGRDVQLHTDYLNDTDSLALLADADLVVFAYQRTGESSSAAVRFGIATGRLVAVTPLPIFRDLEGAVARLPGTTAEAMATGIADLIGAMRDDATHLHEQRKEASRWLKAHSHRELALRLYHLLLGLRRKQLDH